MKKMSFNPLPGKAIENAKAILKNYELFMLGNIHYGTK